VSIDELFEEFVNRNQEELDLCEEMIGIEKQYLIDAGEDAYYLSYRENEEEYDY
jgi:HEPN domain-containing protein